MSPKLRVFAIIAVVAGCANDEPPGWMADVPDEQSLAALTIPGTHDSAAMFEPIPGVARTQDLEIEQQLAAGVRFLDLRCRHFEDTFLLYHGGVDQNLTFDDLLVTVYGFLDAHPTETILATIKEETAPSGNTRTFDATLASYIAQSPEHWLLSESVPTLGDARGRIVLIRRFASDMPAFGIDATMWADNATFTIADPDATLEIEDEYMVTANDAKWTAITQHLDAARTGDASSLFLTFTSGYQTMNGLPNIPIVSDDINARFDALISDPAAAGRLGVLVLDHVTPARVTALLAAGNSDR